MLFFLKILFLFLVFNFSIFFHTFQWKLSHFFKFFLFSSRKSQSQQRLEKMFTHFAIQFCSKNLTHFMNLNSLNLEKNMLLQHSQKPFTLQVLQPKFFCLVLETKFALHHFLTPNNCTIKTL